MNNSSHLTSFSNPLKPLPYIALLRLSMSYNNKHTNNVIGFCPEHYKQNIRDFKAKKPRSGTFSYQYFYWRLLEIESISHGVIFNNNFINNSKKAKRIGSRVALSP
jgi:hypothetical protein